MCVGCSHTNIGERAHSKSNTLSRTITYKQLSTILLHADKTFTFYFRCCTLQYKQCDIFLNYFSFESYFAYYTRLCIKIIFFIKIILCSLHSIMHTKMLTTLLHTFYKCLELLRVKMFSYKVLCL